MANRSTAAGDLPFDASSAEEFAKLFLHFHRAGQLAKAYSDLQRSSHLVIGALAILIAGLAVGDGIWGEGHPAIITTDFFASLISAAIVFVSHRQRWLERWVDYRLLTEIFRSAKFLLVSGGIDPFENGHLRSGPHSWVRDFAMAVLRSVKIAMPGKNEAPNASAVERARHYVEVNYLSAQILYNSVTAAMAKGMATLISRLARWLAVAVTLGVLVKVIQRWALPGLETTTTDHALTIALALLPAIAASLLALRSYNQYDVVVRRCDAMERSLGDLIKHDSAVINVHELTQFTLAAAHIVLRDVDGWSDVFATQRL